MLGDAATTSAFPATYHESLAMCAARPRKTKNASFVIDGTSVVNTYVVGRSQLKSAR
jgi:hypothetical protein